MYPKFCFTAQSWKSTARSVVRTSWLGRILIHEAEVRILRISWVKRVTNNEALHKMGHECGVFTTETLIRIPRP